ncbi:MAG: DUF998 domain-containing protein [Candidatus Hermodarchaeota archaeon]
MGIQKGQFRMDIRSFAAWAGMIGPVLFVGVFTVEGFLRPAYNPLSMYVSELSIGPRGWVQVLNFIIFGALFLIFALGVTIESKEQKSSQLGPILLNIIGLLFLLSGPFVMDPATTPRNEWSLFGTVHQLLGALAFVLFPVSCFVFWWRFKEDPEWQSLRWGTLIAGLIIVVGIILLRIGPTMPPEPPNAFNAWVGLIQRVIIIPYLAWIFTFAFMFRKRRIQSMSKINLIPHENDIRSEAEQD